MPIAYLRPSMDILPSLTVPMRRKLLLKRRSSMSLSFVLFILKADYSVHTNECERPTQSGLLWACTNLQIKFRNFYKTAATSSSIQDLDSGKNEVRECRLGLAKANRKRSIVFIGPTETDILP